MEVKAETLTYRALEDGSGVKHLDRKSSRPVTWVIKIKHAGLGVLGQATSDLAPPEIAERQATSVKQLTQLESIRNYESYRCIKDHREPEQTFQDAWMGLRFTCKRMQNRREAGKNSWLCLL